MVKYSQKIISQSKVDEIIFKLKWGASRVFAWEFFGQADRDRWGPFLVFGRQLRLAIWHYISKSLAQKGVISVFRGYHRKSEFENHFCSNFLNRKAKLTPGTQMAFWKPFRSRSRNFFHKLKRNSKRTKALWCKIL